MNNLKSIRTLENDAYISLRDAAKYCPYSQEYLSLRARQGKLKAIKNGRNWVTKQEWIKEYEKQQIRASVSHTSSYLLLAQRFFVLFFAVIIILFFFYILITGAEDNNPNTKKVSLTFENPIGKTLEYFGAGYLKCAAMAGNTGIRSLRMAEFMGEKIGDGGFVFLKETAKTVSVFGRILGESEFNLGRDMKSALWCFGSAIEDIDHKVLAAVKEVAVSWENLAVNIPKTEAEFNSLIKICAEWKKIARAEDINVREMEESAQGQVQGIVKRNNLAFSRGQLIFNYTNFVMMGMLDGAAFLMDESVAALDRFFYGFE